MTGTTRTTAELDPRRRRVLYRAWHRGTREMDFIFGRFTDEWIDRMSDTELDEFERILDAGDTELFLWVAGQMPVPAEYDTELFRRIRAFHGVPAGPGGQDLT